MTTANRNERSRELAHQINVGQSNQRSIKLRQAMNKPATITVDTTLQCPDCKLPELNPDTGLLNFRGFKVMDKKGYWWSHCLVCDHWF
jgi:hypothetical protein